MKYLIPTTLVVLALVGTMLMAGCGGSGSPPGGGPGTLNPARAGVSITESPTLEQLKADLAKVGKPLPDFLGGGTTPAAAPAGSVSPASYMTVLSLGYWFNGQYVARYRTQWYVCTL